jgi:Flp pilus assembly protein TadG
MMGASKLLARLWRENHGSAVIETALIAPVLVCMCLGGFEISRMMARQSELQTGANEATSIVLAAPPDSDTKKATAQAVIAASTGLTNDSAHIQLDFIYRCGTNTTLTATKADCGTQAISTYIQVQLRDTYTPIWTQFGVGSPLNYYVSRRVQLS